MVVTTFLIQSYTKHPKLGVRWKERKNPEKEILGQNKEKRSAYSQHFI